LKFSFVVPIYNIEFKYLKECINSLVNQSYQNIEIILVNDGSTKNVDEECIKKMVKNDLRIKYIYQHNQGVSIARNN